jgi:hypothetical protein
LILYSADLQGSNTEKKCKHSNIPIRSQMASTPKDKPIDDYKKKLRKYVKYVLDYLEKMILDDDNSLTITCEAIHINYCQSRTSS